MVGYLAKDWILISRDRVRNLMRRLGWREIDQKPRTIPLQKRFPYLVAIMDLQSRHGLIWRLTKSLDREFSLEALEMALEGGRKLGGLPFRSGLPDQLIRLHGQAADWGDQDQLVRAKAMLQQKPR